MNRDLGDWMDVEDEREGGVKVSGLNKLLIMETEMDNRNRTDLDEGTDGIKDEIPGVLKQRQWCPAGSWTEESKDEKEVMGLEFNSKMDIFHIYHFKN